MGTWGPGIFDDDVALDVKAMFEEDLASGHTVEDAAQHVLNAPPWGFDDEEDAAVTLLALATLLLDHNELSETIKEKAVNVIDSGVPLWRWDGLPDEQVSARKASLLALRQRLLEVNSQTNRDI